MEHLSPSQRVVIRKLDPQPGDTVLELAAGLGRHRGHDGTLGGRDGSCDLTDFAPEMVAAARQRAEELGVENTGFRVLDAERMDLETDSVDGVRCRWGYMLKIDPAACCGQDVD